MSLFEGSHKPHKSNDKAILIMLLGLIAYGLLVYFFYSKAIGGEVTDYRTRICFDGNCVLTEVKDCKRTITGPANPLDLCDNTCDSNGSLISTSYSPHDCKYYLSEDGSYYIPAKKKITYDSIKQYQEHLAKLDKEIEESRRREELLAEQVKLQEYQIEVITNEVIK